MKSLSRAAKAEIFKLLGCPEIPGIVKEIDAALSIWNLAPAPRPSERVRAFTSIETHANKLNELLDNFYEDQLSRKGVNSGIKSELVKLAAVAGAIKEELLKKSQGPKKTKDGRPPLSGSYLAIGELKRIFRLYYSGRKQEPTRPFSGPPEYETSRHCFIAAVLKHAGYNYRGLDKGLDRLISDERSSERSIPRYRRGQELPDPGYMQEIENKNTRSLEPRGGRPSKKDFFGEWPVRDKPHRKQRRAEKQIALTNRRAKEAKAEAKKWGGLLNKINP